MPFAPYASGEFNKRLGQALDRLAQDVEQALGKNLAALVLGGGYGRGEGAMQRVNGREESYNDLDLVLIVERKNPVPWNDLTAIAKKYQEKLQVHVDFSRPLTVRDIERWPRWLMWYDLLHGHVVLAGPLDILTRHAPPTLEAPLPLIEGTRLLLNRGAGLLWSMRIVRGVDPAPDPDFIRRNFYKCALALGDALLIAYSRFQTAYRGRDVLFERLAKEFPEVAALDLGSLYDQALQFKFCPDEFKNFSGKEEELIGLAGKWASVFLWVETLRTGRPWTSLGEYSEWRGCREPELNRPAAWIPNFIRNGRLGVCSLQYPREKLYCDLPRLLDVADSPVNDWPRETAEFLNVWHGYN